MTSPRSDLSAFAAALAVRLPGAWTSAYPRHLPYADQFPIAEQLWDMRPRRLHRQPVRPQP